MPFHLGDAFSRRRFRLATSSAYRHKAISTGQIRLLEITDVADVVTCSLSIHSIKAVPSFRALSYVWGTDKTAGEILCNGKRLAITSHLLEGLQTLYRSFGKNQLFWIDAICINQRDDIEKAAQVPLMSKIYSAAETVVIWLGPAADDSDLAMSSIASLNIHFSKIDSLETLTWNTLVSNSLPALDDPVWPAIVKLTFRNWFWRVWVVQEAILAKSIDVICGDRRVGFDDFSRCVDNIRLSALLQNIMSSHQIFPTGQDSGLSSLPIIYHYRREWELGRMHGKVLTVGLLDLSSRKLATEPVDKIYGILGLLSKDLQEKIRVDYSPGAKEKYWQLYIDVTKLLLEKYGVTILEMTTGTIDHNLPSWCPDYSTPRSFYQGSHTFRAGLGSNEDSASSILEFLDQNRLSLRGANMDSIHHVLPLRFRKVDSTEPVNTEAQLFIEREALCADLARKVYRSKETPLEHKITLVKGLTTHHKAYPVSQIVEDYQNCVDYYRTLAVAIPADARDMILRPETKTLRSINRYQNVVGAEGASYFSTTGGCVGIGPANLQPGDSICIIFSALVPYILRFDDTQGIYKFVGSAYVYGLMTGEAFYARDPVRTHQIFVIG